MTVEREFYNNPSGLPYIRNLEHGLVGGSRTAILKIVKETVDVQADDQNYDFEHGLNKHVDFFGRWRNETQKNNGIWNMIQSYQLNAGNPGGVYVIDMGVNKLTLKIWPNVSFTGNIYIELYFIDFGVDGSRV